MLWCYSGLTRFVLLLLMTVDVHKRPQKNSAIATHTLKQFLNSVGMVKRSCSRAGHLIKDFTLTNMTSIHLLNFKDIASNSKSVC